MKKAGLMRFLEQLGLMGDKIDRHVHKIAGHHRDILIASRFKRGDEPRKSSALVVLVGRKAQTGIA